MRRAGSRPDALALALLAALAGGAGGCVDDFGPATCDRSSGSNPPQIYTDGTTVDGRYMTSPWDGRWIWFPGGMHLRVVHNLGRAPRLWNIYASFEEFGTACPDPDAGADTDAGCEHGTTAMASGNMAEVHDVDETGLTVVNGSCADYYVLVTAQ